jgi:hypothetical protein
MPWMPYGRILIQRNTNWITFQTNTTSDQFKVGFVGSFIVGDGVLIRRLFPDGSVGKARKIYAKDPESLVEDFGIPEFLVNAGISDSVIQIRRISSRYQNNLNVFIDRWI